jgi:hypothetical protein
MTMRFAIAALTGAALSFGQGFAQTPANSSPVPARVLTVADAAPDSKGVRRMVVLRGLDKVTGRAIDINAPAGVPVNFGTLIMTARFCYTVPPEEPPETTAFLQIDEAAKRGEPAKRLFSGWMFASTPALNALEHPVYDVWVITCRTDEPAPVAAAAVPAPGAAKAASVPASEAAKPAATTPPTTAVPAQGAPKQ